MFRELLRLRRWCSLIIAAASFILISPAYAGDTDRWEFSSPGNKFHVNFCDNENKVISGILTIDDKIRQANNWIAYPETEDKFCAITAKFMSGNVVVLEDGRLLFPFYGRWERNILWEYGVKHAEVTGVRSCILKVREIDPVRSAFSENKYDCIVIARDAEACPKFADIKLDAPIYSSSFLSRNGYAVLSMIEKKGVINLLKNLGAPEPAICEIR